MQLRHQLKSPFIANDGVVQGKLWNHYKVKEGINYNSEYELVTDASVLNGLPAEGALPDLVNLLIYSPNEYEVKSVTNDQDSKEKGITHLENAIKQGAVNKEKLIERICESAEGTGLHIEFIIKVVCNSDYEKVFNDFLKDSYGGDTSYHEYIKKEQEVGDEEEDKSKPEIYKELLDDHFDNELWDIEKVKERFQVYIKEKVTNTKIEDIVNDFDVLFVDYTPLMGYVPEAIDYGLLLEDSFSIKYPSNQQEPERPDITASPYKTLKFDIDHQNENLSKLKINSIYPYKGKTPPNSSDWGAEFTPEPKAGGDAYGTAVLHTHYDRDNPKKPTVAHSKKGSLSNDRLGISLIKLDGFDDTKKAFPTIKGSVAITSPTWAQGYDFYKKQTP